MGDEWNNTNEGEETQIYDDITGPFSNINQ